MRRSLAFAIAAYVTLFGFLGYPAEEHGPKPVHAHISWDGSRRMHPPKHGRLGWRERGLRHNIRGTAKNGAFGKRTSGSSVIGLPFVTVGPSGSGAQYTAASLGQGYTALTPNGTLTKTAGIQEALDYIKHVGGGVLSLVPGHVYTTTVQVVFWNAAQLQLNNAEVTCSGSIQCPFISDPTTPHIQTDWWGMYVDGGGYGARGDVAVGGLITGTNTISNATTEYQFYNVQRPSGCTITSITTGGNATAGNYGVVIVAPGTNLVVTTTGAAPVVTQLTAVLTIAGGSYSDFDIGIGRCGGGTSNTGRYAQILCGYNVNGTSQGQFANNNIVSLQAVTTGGEFGLRCMGSANGTIAIGENNWESVAFQGIDSGATGTAIAIDLAGQTDHNVFQSAYISFSPSAGAGTIGVMLNDGTTFLNGAASSSANQDCAVNNNEFKRLSFQMGGGANAASIIPIYANKSGVTANSSDNYVWFDYNGPNFPTTPISVNNGAVISGRDRELNLNIVNSCYETFNLQQGITNTAPATVQVTPPNAGWFDVEVDVNVRTGTTIAMTGTINYEPSNAGAGVSDTCNFMGNAGTAVTTIVAAGRYTCRRQVYAKAGVAVSFVPAGTFTTSVVDLSVTIIPRY